MTKRRVGSINDHDGSAIFDLVELVFDDGLSRPYFVADPPPPGRPYFGPCRSVMVNYSGARARIATVEKVCIDPDGQVRVSLKNYRPFGKADRLHEWRLFILDRFDDFRRIWLPDAIREVEEWNAIPSDRHGPADVERHRVFASHLAKLPQDPDDWTEENLTSFDAALGAWFKEQDEQLRPF